MRNFAIAFFVFCFAGIACRAQDKAVLLSPSMFDADNPQLFFGSTKGWLFKAGNDPAWAAANIGLKGWTDFTPAQFSTANADKDGRAEGWFRIKIRIDTAFGDQKLGFKMGTWAASDLYLDGKLIASFGETGKNGAPYAEFQPFGQFPVPIFPAPGSEHLIAIHVVDYVSPTPPRRLKSADLGMESLVRLTGTGYNTRFLHISKENAFYGGVWISVTLVLSLLFWLLSVQNPLEKNLRLVAIGSTILMLQILLVNGTVVAHIGTSHLENVFYNYLANLVTGLLIVYIPFFLAKIFRRSISIPMRVVLLASFAAFVATSDLLSSPVPSTIICFFPFLICIYYIVTSWKSLTGAQWAIVAGFLASFFGGLLYVVMAVIQTSPLIYLYGTIYALAAPLGMMVYVSMRFKEIIHEVRIHAQQVVLLSEEKKEQALHQREMLQKEVNKQTAELRTTLADLNATQSQLIQSEKMASLGELTAGIAHEIQNPLNFVNNFAEVNTELIDEMAVELARGDIVEANTIAANIRENLVKIAQHGKRADSIVKGMLQHSRTGSGKKDPTDINALADEALRLAYHGLRAKDKSFNATMRTDYDETIGLVSIVPQEISRVVLNLVGNAFFSVMEKKKGLPPENPYAPTVTVKTKKEADKVLITIADNGNGVPPAIIEKIFQPFFTTKAPGKGTGLGLSISYDIITKMHGGELRINTKEGEFAEFVIELPLT